MSAGLPELHQLCVQGPDEEVRSLQRRKGEFTEGEYYDRLEELFSSQNDAALRDSKAVVPEVWLDDHRKGDRELKTKPLRANKDSFWDRNAHLLGYTPNKRFVVAEGKTLGFGARVDLGLGLRAVHSFSACPESHSRLSIMPRSWFLED